MQHYYAFLVLYSSQRIPLFHWALKHLRWILNESFYKKKFSPKINLLHIICKNSSKIHLFNIFYNDPSPKY